MRKSILWAMVAVAAAHQQFCKCQCGENEVIEKIDKCGLCNKEWCLQQNSEICPKETKQDILISCFQIESAKEKWIISLFVVAVLVLVVSGFRRP